MNIQELLNRTDRFAANAGCRITEVDANHAVAEMLVTNDHLNGGNVCQGGALFTLADLAIAALMNYREQLTFGISNSIMFVATCFGLKPSVSATTTRFLQSKSESPIRKTASSVTSRG